MPGGKSQRHGHLVFQSVAKGAPMRDNNILVRHIKPAARGRRSPVGQLAGACGGPLYLIKDAQALMRHSRAATTLDIYRQLVPESQWSARLDLLAKSVS